MTIADTTNFASSIRLTSIEHTKEHNDQVKEIFDRHGFVAEFKSVETVNAPFCGVDYHVQEISLTEDSDADTQQWLPCLEALTIFEQTQLADGFFEIVG